MHSPINSSLHNSVMSEAPQFIRTVRIGGVIKTDLLDRLRKYGVQLNPFAMQLFSHEGFQTSAEPCTVKVVQVSVAELGLSRGGVIDEIFDLAQAHGYSLCPLELAPHFRLAFADQPEGFVGQPLSQNCAPPGSVTVASLPVSQDEEVPRGFYLRVIEGVPWLRGYRSWPGHVRAPHDVFAFVM
jgi:hypothetical protein